MTVVCPECDKELAFYPHIMGDEELNSGVYVCETSHCENENDEVYDSGDLE